MFPDKIGIQKRKVVDCFDHGFPLYHELSNFNFYFFRINENESYKKHENKMLMEEVEVMLSKIRTRFFVIRIKVKPNNDCISFCFEGNYLLFQINKDQEDITIPQGIKNAIEHILSSLNKEVEFLFSSKKEIKKFKECFLCEKYKNILFPNSIKRKEIKDEIYNIWEYFQENYERMLIKEKSIDLKALLIYIIRRNYYESKTFFDPSFFDKDINEEKNWKHILENDIKIKDIENNIIRKDEIRRKFGNFGIIKSQKISKDEYILLRSVKKSTFARIKLVIHIKSWKLLIQKEYSKEYFDFFDREKENYEQFSYHHPNILKYYGFNEETELKSIFLEFMSNDTLKTLITDQKDKITETMKYQILFSLVFVLELFDKKKFVFRDLKPDNIFIDHDFNFYIGDFNVSKRGPQNNVSIDFGEQKYKAPEILNNLAYSCSADVYSFGIILFEVFKCIILPDDFNKSNKLEISDGHEVVNKIIQNCIQETRNGINSVIMTLKRNSYFFKSFFRRNVIHYDINYICKYGILLYNIEELQTNELYFNLVTQFLKHGNSLLSANQINNIIKIFFLFVFGVPILKFSSNLRNSDANFVLGKFYLFGQGEIGKIIERSIHYLELSSKQNNSDAQYYLGIIYLKGEYGILKNINKAFHYLELSSNQGNSDAQYTLGIIFFLGRDEIKRDITKGIHYWELASNQKNSNAQLIYGFINLFGEWGNQKNILKAIYYFELLSNLNNPYAQFILGKIYYEGKDVIKKDLRKAVHYFELLSYQNNSDAQFYLGYIYFRGEDGIKKDFRKAAQYFELSSYQNNSDANYFLGIIYNEGGHGIKKNTNMAIDYFKKSSNNYKQHAHFFLGSIYYFGNGEICRDFTRVINYLESSSNYNNPQAQFILGKTYYFGEGVSKNPNKGIHYLTLSLNQNYPDAQLFFGLAFYFGNSEFSNDIKSAIHYLELSSNQKNSIAQCYLGKIYITGERGINKDIDRGIHYLELSSNQKNSIAQCFLGKIYIKGERGINKDFDRGFHYLKLSADGGNHESQFLYGIYNHLYLNDIIQAIRYYKEASCFEIKGAKNNLGVLYMYMGEMSNDKSKSQHYLGNAIEFFSEAISKNDELAFINLYQIYTANISGIKNRHDVNEIFTHYSTMINNFGIDQYYYYMRNLANKPTTRVIQSFYDFCYLYYDYFAKDDIKPPKVCEIDFYKGLNN